jgi:hypothetical protein
MIVMGELTGGRGPGTTDRTNSLGKASGSSHRKLVDVSPLQADVAPTSSALNPIDRAATTYVAGHRGLVGSAVWRHFASAGFSDLVGATSSEVDLRDSASTYAFFDRTNPRYVVMAAAKVGGIMANATYPADFLSDNIRIQLNVLEAAYDHGVERLLFLGSSCIYPKMAPQPINEDSLLTGPLEPTNDAYAIAKIAGVMQVQALRRQHGVNWISAMPTNLYGPGDNFDLQTSHVLPAMIARFHTATETNAPNVTLTSRFASSRCWSPTSSATRASCCSTRPSPTARRGSCLTCIASRRSVSRRASVCVTASPRPTPGTWSTSRTSGRSSGCTELRRRRRWLR